MYVMVYYFDLNNIQNTIKTDLNIINQYFIHHILTQSELKSLETRK